MNDVLFATLAGLIKHLSILSKHSRLDVFELLLNAFACCIQFVLGFKNSVVLVNLPESKINPIFTGDHREIVVIFDATFRVSRKSTPFFAINFTEVGALIVLIKLINWFV